MDVEKMLLMDNIEKSKTSNGARHKFRQGGKILKFPSTYGSTIINPKKLSGPCITYNLYDKSTWPEYMKKDSDG